MDRKLRQGTKMSLAFIVFSASAAAITLSLAETPETGDDAAAMDEFRKYAKETAAEYQIRSRSDENHKLVLLHESLLRWTNPLGGRKAHGDVFLWTNRGRPEAVLSLYQLTESGVVHEHHEFCSLSLGGLSGLRRAQPSWSPVEAGVELKSFSEAPVPASSARLRLVTMRRLAERLRADKTTREDVKRELRLLPKPLYRYESDDPNVLDGALFSFVEANDPEVLLLLEARAIANEKSKFEWQYGLARMNSVRLRVFRGEETLWEAPELPWRDALDRPDMTYTALRIR